MENKALLDGVSKLQNEFLHLLDVKAEKLVNEVLIKNHTQLSYLPKSEQEKHRALAKERILIHLLNNLRKI